MDTSLAGSHRQRHPQGATIIGHSTVATAAPVVPVTTTISSMVHSQGLDAGHKTPQTSANETNGHPQQQRARKRTRATPDQLAVLESTFSMNPSPNSRTREQLSERLGMSERSIQIWFQNRRAKVKNINRKTMMLQDTTLRMQQYATAAATAACQAVVFRQQGTNDADVATTHPDLYCYYYYYYYYSQQQQLWKNKDCIQGTQSMSGSTGSTNNSGNMSDGNNSPTSTSGSHSNHFGQGADGFPTPPPPPPAPPESLLPLSSPTSATNPTSGWHPTPLTIPIAVPTATNTTTGRMRAHTISTYPSFADHPVFPERASSVMDDSLPDDLSPQEPPGYHRAFSSSSPVSQPGWYPIKIAGGAESFPADWAKHVPAHHPDPPPMMYSKSETLDFMSKKTDIDDMQPWLLSAEALQVGTWKRINLCPGDLTCGYDSPRRVFAWCVQDGQQRFKMEFSVDAVSKIHLRQLPERMGWARLELHLSHPALSYYMEQAQSGVWMQCHDYTQDKQATTVLVHHMDGPALALHAEMTRIAQRDPRIRCLLQDEVACMPVSGQSFRQWLDNESDSVSTAGTPMREDQMSLDHDESAHSISCADGHDPSMPAINKGSPPHDLLLFQSVPPCT